jgi:Helix-hairpin-helix containing domain
MRVLGNLIILLFMNGFCPSAQAQDTSRHAGEIEYPIVVTTAEKLATFGLSIIGYEPRWPALTHLCYFPIGPGAIEFLSVSHERLIRYQEMGFTLNSLCLGLVSSTRFDPETGTRLPTYVAAYTVSLRRKFSAERPLELPKCFSRALIYTDCEFNFDRRTGKPLSENQKQAFKKLGRLARDIRGIGFKSADAIAMKLGIEKTAMIRLRAGISYALTEAMDEGHCGLPTDQLIPLAEETVSERRGS